MRRFRKKALEMVRIHGRNYDQIAFEMQMPKKTVAERIKAIRHEATPLGEEIKWHTMR